MGAPRDAAKEAPPAANDLAAAAFEGAPTAAAVIEMTGGEPTLLHVNRALCELSGYARENLSGIRLGQVIDGLEDVLLLLVERGSLLEVPAECVRPDGGRVAILLHAAMLDADSGRGSLAMLQAKALTSPLFAVHGETEKKVQDLLDNVDALIFIKGADGRYLMSNLALRGDGRDRARGGAGEDRPRPLPAPRWRRSTPETTGGCLPPASRWPSTSRGPEAARGCR